MREFLRARVKLTGRVRARVRARVRVRVGAAPLTQPTRPLASRRAAAAPRLVRVRDRVRVRVRVEVRVRVRVRVRVKVRVRLRISVSVTLALRVRVRVTIGPPRLPSRNHSPPSGTTLCVTPSASRRATAAEENGESA